MIKKLIVFALLAFMLFSTTAQAMPTANSEDINIEYTLNKTTAQMDGYLQFTISVSNNTDKDIMLKHFTQVFEGGYATGVATDAIAGITLPAGKTITEEINYFVPSLFKVYNENDGYYASFSPVIAYSFLSGTSPDIEYAKSDKQTPIKISNIKDGSNFVNLTRLDNKSIIGIRETNQIFKASGYPQYFAQLDSVLKVESLKENQDIRAYIYQENQDYLDFSLFEGQETLVFEHRNMYYFDEKPSSITSSFGVLFQMDTQFYYTKHQQTYTVEQVDIPQLSIEEINTYCADVAIFSSKYRIFNNTDEAANNLLIYYGNLNLLHTDEIENFENSTMYASIAPGDDEFIPLSSRETQDTFITVGYILDNVYYYKSFSRTVGEYSTEQSGENIYPFSDFIYSFSLDTIENNSVVTFPTPIPTLEPTPDATAFDVKFPTPTPEVTPTPDLENTNQQIDDIIYRPPYFYLFFGILILVILLIATLILRWVFIKKNNSTKNN